MRPGIQVKVASREDVTQRELWDYSDPHRRSSKRKKDELEPIRFAETDPELKFLNPDRHRYGTGIR
jgi:hypothetical protein